MGALGPSSSRGSLSPAPTGGGASNLADVLERVLDKGIVIAGDIQINLLDIELLTIKLRLVIASVDTARRMGISWWENDPMLAGAENHHDHPVPLTERVENLERELEQRTQTSQPET
jgi:hypothetical protein